MKVLLKASLLLLSSVILVTGCATSSGDLSATYVSPLTYKRYSCRQLENELVRVSNQVNSLAGQVDHKAKNDKIKTGVGVLLFWPTLFFLDGDGPQAQQYSQLKGEFNALDTEMKIKHCA